MLTSWPKWRIGAEVLIVGAVRRRPVPVRPTWTQPWGGPGAQKPGGSPGPPTPGQLGNCSPQSTGRQRRLMMRPTSASPQGR